MAVMTGLSGNEIFCLRKKDLLPGDLIIGNSVYSMGVFGSIGSGLKTLMGGEVTQVTELIHDGRAQSLARMVSEAERRGGVGITGVTSELVHQMGNIEFLSVGSTLHRENVTAERLQFSSSADGQELYCQMDCGFQPVRFVFGNVAYSIGVGGGLMGSLRSLGKGEVKEYSQVFNDTRHRALARITEEAIRASANAVVGIRINILPFQGMQEMIMVGTASNHPALPPTGDGHPITSDLTNEEMWNLIHLGYMPIRLLLGVSVYSLGVIGGVTAALKGLGRGEISELTNLIYQARENAIERIASEASAIGADDVVGIRTYVYQLGGNMIEFMAVGTAVKRMANLTTVSDSLPPQAIIQDKATLINTAETALGRTLNTQTTQ